LTLPIKRPINVSETVLIHRFSPLNCSIKGKALLILIVLTGLLVFENYDDLNNAHSK